LAYYLTDESKKLRPYQRRALEIALRHEGTVLALPTGTGKTLIACAWACQLLNRQAAKRILVLEPSRYLVEQSYTYFSEHTNIRTGKVYGTTPAHERLAILRDQQYKVMVTTAQSALNDICALDFDAIIVDECHHTTGAHAYHELLRWDLFTPMRFFRRLGLSATIPETLRYQVKNAIGPVYSWSWVDPEIAPYVPSWYSEVYDTELEADERRIFDILRQIRSKSEVEERWIASLAIRMLVRDGVLALLESGRKKGRLARLLGLSEQTFLEELFKDSTSAKKEWRDVGRLLQSGRCPPLHKLQQLGCSFAEHDFNKAVVFVDRVVIAKALKREFPELNPVLLLGRLHGGTEAQQVALKAIRETSSKLLISTSAGEEGLDVPEVDMVVTWSITANPVRFVQRQGRGMRAGSGERRRPKVNIFLATPDTPDYEALHRGMTRAKAAESIQERRLTYATQNR